MLTKNDMNRVTVQALYNLPELPSETDRRVTRRDRLMKSLVIEGYNRAVKVLHEKMMSEEGLEPVNTVVLTRTSDKEEADMLVDLIQGKTFMQFDAGAAPAGGEFEIFVTAVGRTQKEMTGMVICLLSHEAVVANRKVAILEKRINLEGK